MDEPLIPLSSEAESAHKIGHTSTPTSRIEVITRGERRRRWTPEQKREIVMESLRRGLTPTEVARKHGIGSGQLYTWRQQMLGGHMASLVRPRPDFAQVEMETSKVQTASPASGLIEIVLPNGLIVRVDAEVNAEALRRVLAALGQR